MSFYCHCEHRDLHSFPTRRSSDLSTPQLEVARRRTPAQAAYAFPAHEVKNRDRLVFPEPRDRKSTRLNSSHSQISYAVFCLKKKCMAFAPIKRSRLQRES